MPDKFGGAEAAAEASSPLQIPKGMVAVSVSLSDPGRVAGFVNPGSDVGDLPQRCRRPDRPGLQPAAAAGGAGARCRLDHHHDDDHDDHRRSPDEGELPRTLLTLALSQEDAQKVLFAQGNGELALGAAHRQQRVLKMDDGANTDNLFK